MSVFSAISRVLSNRQLGISLVEVLIYTTVFSIASIGIFALLNGLKNNRIDITSNAKQAEQADYATKYIQTQLGRSDSVSVDNVTAGDQACLKLRENHSVRRDGTVFDGNSRYIETEFESPMAREESVTVSFWVWMDRKQQGSGNIVNWGSNANKGQFGVMVFDGNLALSFVGAKYDLLNGNDLRDSKWHHIAITYDPKNKVPPLPGNSIRVYIDNKLMVGKYESFFAPDFETLMITPRTRLYVGSLRNETSYRFNGVVSDLRIWRTVLSAAEIQKLATAIAPVTIQTNALHYHWPLNTVPKGKIRFLGTGPMSWAGLFYGDWKKDTVFGTADETSQVTHFCFYDQNKNGLFELWTSQVATQIPKPAPTAPDWQRVTEDMFVPKDDGIFFQAVSKSPDSVIANFALGTNRYNQPALQQKAQTSNFSSKVSFKSKALCRIVKSDLMKGNCRFSAAFAKINTDYDKDNESLGIFNATSTTNAATGVVTYANIPYASSQLRGEWYPDRGFLRIFTQDGSDLALKDWNKIFKEITYLPKASSYKPHRSVVFSLGDLAFDTGQGFRFYDFHKATTSPYKYSDAARETSNLPNSKCGIQPYIATITSAEEQDFIQQKMHHSTVHDGWQSGWIGAFGNIAQTWKWDNGPEIGQTFWVGGPFDYGIRKSDNVEIRVQRLIAEQVNPLYSKVPDRVAFRRKNDIWASQTDEFHYTNFSYGIEGRMDCATQAYNRYCQPWKTRNYSRIAAYGSYGQGLWFAAPENTLPCNGPALYSICGHYVEWGGMGNDPDVTIANRTSIDVATHREYCQLE